VASPVWFSAKFELSVLILISAMLILGSGVAAYSFALGGLIYVIPNLYFVHYAFRFQGAVLAPLIVRSFGWGESGKIALVAVGFVLVYRLIDPLHDLSVFAGFGTMIVIQWFVAVRLIERHCQPEKN